MDGVAYILDTPRKWTVVLQRLVEDKRLREAAAPYTCQERGVPFVHGIAGWCADLLLDRSRRGLPYGFADHAYLLRAPEWRRRHGKGSIEAWYRLCFDGMQCKDWKEWPDDRWRRIQRMGELPDPAPYDGQGDYLLVCPPGKAVCDILGLGDWEASIREVVPHFTERPLRIRYKQGDNRPLAEDLAECWGVITPQSTVAVHAVLAGKPVWVHDGCCARRVGRGLSELLTTIESPHIPTDQDRLAWLSWLAYNQFQLPEFSNGFAWEILRQQIPGFD